MSAGHSLFAELKRRNVLRAAALYIGAAWALAQGIAQLSPAIGLPDWATRWFLVAAAIGFPFAMAFSWFYEWTPRGIVRESEVEPGDSITRETGRKMDRWIIAVMAVAIVLLIADIFVPHQDAASTTATTPDKSIAVLPFENISDDKGNAYFADGMQDEILTRLSKIGSLRVISRTSTLPFASHPESLPEIAKKLGVATILEGSVQKSGNKVRIIVQLIRAQDEKQLWGETYDRSLKDVFGVQGEVAGAIADQLGATLTGKAREEVAQVATRNPVALDAYLRGTALNRQGFTDTLAFAALQSYGEAVKADPDFAQAWAAIARMDSFMIFLGIDGSPERRASALQALQAAERLQPDALETQVARAIYAYGVERDFESARKRFA